MPLHSFSGALFSFEDSNFIHIPAGKHKEIETRAAAYPGQGAHAVPHDAGAPPVA
jgi:hypothetical protein